MSNPIPQWPAAVKGGFEAFAKQKLITEGQNVAVPVNPKDPKSLYVLNIGTTKANKAGTVETNYEGHARTMFIKSAGKNLFAIPYDVVVRIAKVVTFYNVFFDSKTSFSLKGLVTWLKDIGRILASPFTWPIIVATELFAAVNPSAFARNAVAKLENALLENNKLNYLKPMTRAGIDQFAAKHKLLQIEKNIGIQVMLPGGKNVNTTFTAVPCGSILESTSTPENTPGSNAKPLKIDANNKSNLKQSTLENPLGKGNTNELRDLGFALFSKAKLPASRTLITSLVTANPSGSAKPSSSASTSSSSISSSLSNPASSSNSNDSTPASNSKSIDSSKAEQVRTVIIEQISETSSSMTMNATVTHKLASKNQLNVFIDKASAFWTRVFTNNKSPEPKEAELPNNTSTEQTNAGSNSASMSSSSSASQLSATSSATTVGATWQKPFHHTNALG